MHNLIVWKQLGLDRVSIRHQDDVLFREEGLGSFDVREEMGW